MRIMPDDSKSRPLSARKAANGMFKEAYQLFRTGRRLDLWSGLCRSSQLESWRDVTSSSKHLIRRSPMGSTTVTLDVPMGSSLSNIHAMIFPEYIHIQFVAVTCCRVLGLKVEGVQLLESQEAEVSSISMATKSTQKAPRFLVYSDVISLKLYHTCRDSVAGHPIGHGLHSSK